MYGRTPNIHLQPLLAYDASVDRLVSYYLGEVRLFDLRTGTWSPPGTTSPPFGYGGWGFSLGGEIAYDEAAQRTVLFNMGHVIAYDAAADRWETLYGPPSDGGRADGFCGIRPECRNLHSMVYDPVNERLVVYGGHVHTGADGPGWWGPSDDVLAFDTRTREWTVLLGGEPAGHAVGLTVTGDVTPTRPHPSQRTRRELRHLRLGPCRAREPHNNRCLRRSASRAQDPRPYAA